MGWLASLTKEAGAGGEVQLTLNDDATIDVTTHLGISPDYARVTQDEALDFLQTAFGFSNPEAADLITRTVDTGYSEAPIVIEKASTMASKPVRELFAIAEGVVSDILMSTQITRVAAHKYLVSGIPDGYIQHVAVLHPELNKLDLTRTAALVWAETESYVDNVLATNGRSFRKDWEIFHVYSAAKECRGAVASMEDFVQLIEASIDRPLTNFDIALAGVILSGNEGGILDALAEAFPEADRALVELVLSGDRAALTESLTETTISPENAYMVPQGLPAPAMPGVSYEAKKKRSIPIKLVGQDFWGQEPPSAWLERIKDRTPDAPDELTELRGQLNDHKRVLYQIQGAREIMSGGAEESKERLLELEEDLRGMPESAPEIQVQRRMDALREAEQVHEIWSDLMTVISDIHEPLLSRMGQDVEPITYEEADQALARLSYAVQEYMIGLTEQVETLRRKPKPKKPEEVKPTWRGSWDRIQKNIPIDTLERAITEYGADNPDAFEGTLEFDEARDFFMWLLRPDPETGRPIQKGIGDISNPRSSAYWLAYWLTEHGGTSYEQIYGLEPLIP